jgi:hypothetical protein
LHLTTRSGARLWVDDHLVLDAPAGDHEGTFTARVALLAGEKHSFRLECYDTARARLEWSGPSQFREVVPQRHWYPPSVKVVSFSLVYADTGEPVAGYDPIPDGATLPAYTPGDRPWTVVANTLPALPGVVRYALDGQADSLLPAVPFAPGISPAAWLAQPGTYTLTATPYPGADSARGRGIGRTIRLTVGDERLGPAPERVQLYPNPSAEETRLVFFAPAGEPMTVEVLDATGQRMLLTRLSTRFGKNTVQIPVREFAPGLYLVRLRGNQKQFLIRFLRP